MYAIHAQAPISNVKEFQYSASVTVQEYPILIRNPQIFYKKNSTNYKNSSPLRLL